MSLLRVLCDETNAQVVGGRWVAALDRGHSRISVNALVVNFVVTAVNAFSFGLSQGGVLGSGNRFKTR